MKGICHIWSRGRHFSPSLPGDRYLNLGSKSDLRAEISGSIVWYDALAPRSEVLFSQETMLMAAGENRFAPDLNEKEAIELLEELSNIFGGGGALIRYDMVILSSPRWLCTISYPTRIPGLIVNYTYEYDLTSISLKR